MRETTKEISRVHLLQPPTKSASNPFQYETPS
jgi:hypothetical protein